MRKIKIFMISFLLIGILQVSLSQAREWDRVYKGIRSLGMGNAFVAVAGRHTALQHNVAGLSQVHGRDIVLLNTVFILSNDFFDIYDDVTDLMDSEDLEDLDAENLDNLYHNDLNSRVALQFLNYVDHIQEVNHYGIGVTGIVDVTIDVDRDVMGLPIAEYDVKASTVVMAGYARDFEFQMPFVNFQEKSRLTAGLALKYYNVGKLTDKRHALELVGYAPEDIPKWDGQGFGVDLGMLYPFQVYGQDMVCGLAIQDFGGTKIDYEDDPSHVIPANVRWGLSYRPNMETVPVIHNLLVTFEWEDLFNGEDTTWGEKIHLGFETYLTRYFALRCGFNQGYPTVGGGIDWKYGSLEYAFFGREVGTYVGQHGMYNHALQLKLLAF